MTVKESIFVTKYGVKDIFHDFVQSGEKQHWYHEAWGGCVVAHWLIWDEWEEGMPVIDYDRYVYTSSQVWDAAKAIGIDGEDVAALAAWLNAHQEDAMRYSKTAVCGKQVLMGY